MSATVPTRGGGNPIICSDDMGIATSSPKHETQDDQLDRLVRTASQPSLADLFRSGIKSGALAPAVHYSN